MVNDRCCFDVLLLFLYCIYFSVETLLAGFLYHVLSLHFSLPDNKNTNFDKVVYMSFSNSRILAVESYMESCELISRMLFVEKHNFDFTVTHSPSRALSLIKEQSFDLYIVKSRLPEMTGVELCRRIRKADSEAPILFLTGKTRLSECRVAIAAGVSEYLILPVDLEKLTTKVKELLGKTPAQFQAQSSLPVNGTSFASRPS
jgi:CheY-like chemotaxis protein